MTLDRPITPCPRALPALLACALASAAASQDAPYLVKDLTTGVTERDSWPNTFHPLGGRVYFTAEDGSAGYELWSSDGTPAGTRRVADLNPGPDASYPYVIGSIGKWAAEPEDVIAALR